MSRISVQDGALLIGNEMLSMLPRPGYLQTTANYGAEWCAWSALSRTSGILDPTAEAGSKMMDAAGPPLQYLHPVNKRRALPWVEINARASNLPILEALGV